MVSYSIGQISKQSGVSVETIRYYEREGLLEKPERKESGYRQYNEGVLDRLSFIQQAKNLGFTLSEILELLSLEIKTGTTSKDIKQMAQSKLDNIEEKIRLLKRMQRTLKDLVTQCSGKGTVEQCPILNAIKKK
jgi:MerR family transcriptional regulator, copper efflux regulator